jgi:SAM-dependent methyltransferase
MNWKYLRRAPWLDTRARFVAGTPPGGALLDIGSSDGSTLGHFAELRPDLRLHATDIAGTPEHYPAGCRFFRGDIQKDTLPWPAGSMDAITCMHLVEHLNAVSGVFTEVSRLLKPGGRAYFETPHPKSLTWSSPPGKAAGTFTLNFFDDPTHTRPVPTGAMAQQARRLGLEVLEAGVSRNWLFTASHLWFWLMPSSRQKFTARIHFAAWSAQIIVRKPAATHPR